MAAKKKTLRNDYFDPVNDKSAQKVIRIWILQEF